MNDFSLIGVIHLPEIPFSLKDPHQFMDRLVDNVLKEARLLEAHDFNGVILENYGDKPYSKRCTDTFTLSVLSVIARTLVKETDLNVGISLLRNSGKEAYSIAAASGALFIRVNGLVETLVTDSGIIEPEAPLIGEIRKRYQGIEIYADILCKHAASLYYTTLIQQFDTNENIQNPAEEALKVIIKDSIERGGANALIVTGTRTGEPPSISLIKLVKRYSNIPVIVGSGVNSENIREFLPLADGIIIGSYIRENGIAGNPLSPDRLTKLHRAIKFR